MLERQRDELGRRLERWYERIESDPESGDVGAERLRELKTKRDEADKALAKLRPLHSVPPYLYEAETIQRYQARPTQALTSGDRATARMHVHDLVERIATGEDEITIDARGGAAIAMMAQSGGATSEAAEGEVLADVVDWRPSGDGSKNLTLVVSNPARRQQVPKPPPKPREVPRIVRLLERARAWRALIDGGEAGSLVSHREPDREPSPLGSLWHHAGVRPS